MRLVRRPRDESSYLHDAGRGSGATHEARTAAMRTAFVLRRTALLADLVLPLLPQAELTLLPVAAHRAATTHLSGFAAGPVAAILVVLAAPRAGVAAAASLRLSAALVVAAGLALRTAIGAALLSLALLAGALPLAARLVGPATHGRSLCEATLLVLRTTRVLAPTRCLARVPAGLAADALTVLALLAGLAADLPALALPFESAIRHAVTVDALLVRPLAARELRATVRLLRPFARLTRWAAVLALHRLTIERGAKTLVTPCG